MTKNEKSDVNIGLEYVKNIYTDTSIETMEAQPIYILHRDTIKSFIHEKVNLFGLEGKILGLLGIEVTIITTLLTATFNDWDVIGGRVIKGSDIRGTFNAFAIIFFIWTIYEVWNWVRHSSDLDVDSLVSNLGSRGSVIKPNQEKNGGS